MKKNKTLTIKTILSFAAATLFLACSNVGGGYVANGAGGQKGSDKDGSKETVMVTVNGSLAFGGAYPEQIAALVENSGADGLDGIARSAFPDAASSGLTYSVYALQILPSGSTDTPLRYEGTVAADGKSYTVGIPVTSGKKYRVHAVAKKDDVEALFGISELLDFTTDAEQFYTNCDITLGARQSATGTGCVELHVDVEGAGGVVKSAQMGRKLIGSDTPQVWVGGILSLGSKYKFSKGWIADGVVNDGLASGNYLMTFEFYSGTSYTGELLYSFTECVSVFDGLVTDAWVKNGSEPWLSGSGCQITSAMIDGFGLTEIYVDPSKQTVNPANKDTYTTESGTFLNPKRSFTDALGMLNNASKNYTIYIKGELTGKQTIPVSLKRTTSGSIYTHANSLTLCGAQGLDTNGVPQDSINGNFTTAGSNQCSLSVETTEVPVIIKNLKITGGYSRSFGGGINAVGDVTLDSGTLVTGNKSTLCGGGIAINQKTLTIMSGAVISGNEELCSSGNSGGGGIYCYGGSSVIMLGGTIKGNRANHDGGALFLEEGSSFTMNGGVIGDASKGAAATSDTDSSNCALCSLPSDPGGGAIYFDGSEGGALNLYGGTIAWNYSAGDGGGIYVKSGTVNIRNAISYNGANYQGGGVYITSGTVEMTGGKINGNYGASGGGVYNKGEFNMKGGLIADNQRDTNRNGGAVYHEGTFNIVGNSCIPPASGNQNDFYLSDGKKIIITGALSPTSDGTASGSAVTTVAQITPYRYRDYESVLFRAESPNPMTRIQLETSKFSVTPEGATPWYLRTNGAIYSTQYWGTKAPAVEKNVGDIVYNDGSATPYTAFDESDTSAQKNEIIAIIALKSGSTAYGLGFYEAQKIWCDDSASGYNSYIYDSSTPGATVMDKIKTLGDYNEDKYPAFWYADHYDGGGNLGAYNTDWFIPSYNEMRTMASNKTTINAAIDKARNAYGGNNKFGGDSGGKSYWTASQFGGSSASADYKLVYRYIVPLSSGTSASSGYDKKDSVYVRPIHVF